MARFRSLFIVFMHGCILFVSMRLRCFNVVSAILLKIIFQVILVLLCRHYIWFSTHCCRNPAIPVAAGRPRAVGASSGNPML